MKKRGKMKDEANPGLAQPDGEGLGIRDPRAPIAMSILWARLAPLEASDHYYRGSG